jgi:hypothetical protein
MPARLKAHQVHITIQLDLLTQDAGFFMVCSTQFPKV